jgi:hypothetical protein
MTTVWPNLPLAIWSNEDELLRQLAEAAKLVDERGTGRELPRGAEGGWATSKRGK